MVRSGSHPTLAGLSVALPAIAPPSVVLNAIPPTNGTNHVCLVERFTRTIANGTSHVTLVGSERSTRTLTTSTNHGTPAERFAQMTTNGANHVTLVGSGRSTRKAMNCPRLKRSRANHVGLCPPATSRQCQKKLNPPNPPRTCLTTYPRNNRNQRDSACREDQAGFGSRTMDYSWRVRPTRPGQCRNRQS